MSESGAHAHTAGNGRPVVILGAGGHALVCIDVLRSRGWNVVGCLADGGVAAAELSVPMLGEPDEARRVADEHSASVFVAIGDNRARSTHFTRVQAEGLHVVTAVSPHAIVAGSVQIGSGTLLMPGAVVNAGATIGHAVIVNTRASIDHECRIDDGVHIAPGVALAGRVSVGAMTLVGIGSSVIPGVRIGAGALVAAGAVVTCDVGDGQRVAGVPATLMPTSPRGPDA